MELILFLGIGLVIFLSVIGIVVTVLSERSFVEERLGQITGIEIKLGANHRGEKATPVGDWLDAKLENSKVGGGISRELARADLKLKSGEFFASYSDVYGGAGFCSRIPK